MLNAWRKTQKKQKGWCEENHHEQCTIPKAAKQLPEWMGRRKEGKVALDRGGKLASDTLLLFLIFKNKNVTHYLLTICE